MRDDQENLFVISKNLINFLDGILMHVSTETRNIWQVVVHDLKDI